MMWIIHWMFGLHRTCRPMDTCDTADIAIVLALADLLEQDVLVAPTIADEVTSR